VWHRLASGSDDRSAEVLLRFIINAAWPGNRSMRFSQKSHESIYDEIERKDAQAARRAMSEHMDVTAQELRRVKLLR
jgi:DNA-binding FadR family transcriptional regulator